MAFDREPHAVGKISKLGKLHAVQTRYDFGALWILPLCRPVWHSTNDRGVNSYDYRYREPNNQCRHRACQWGFGELRD